MQTSAYYTTALGSTAPQEAGARLRALMGWLPPTTSPRRPQRFCAHPTVGTL